MSELRAGSLFSGAGGLDMAVEKVFGARVVWHSENHPAAAAVLASRWPGVPNLGDITAIDWQLVEPVAVVCAGWPCQPFSPAGKRKGAADERALWPHVAGALRVLRPRHVVLENVPAVLRFGEFDRVASDLACLGYDMAWTCLRASDVGAPHRRDRLFIIATHPDSPRPQRPEPAPGHEMPTRGGGADVKLLPTPAAADGERGPDFARANRAGSGGDDLITLAARASRTNGWGVYTPAVEHWQELTRPAPPPTVPNTKGTPVLNPQFSEWMQGWPAGWVTDVGIRQRDQHRIIGNGVCPQQACAAVEFLRGRTQEAAA